MERAEQTKMYDAAAGFLLGTCKKDAPFYPMYFRISKQRIIDDVNFLRDHVSKDAAVLDVGAVPPILVELLRRHGFERCQIVDPHPEDFEEYFEQTGVVVHQMDLLRDDPAGLEEEYDLVCLTEVLEHLCGDLPGILGNMTQRLRSGGHLYVTTPNLRSISGMCSLLVDHSGLASKRGEGVYAQYERYQEHGYFGHVREYTGREVREFFEKMGFEHLETRYGANYAPRGRLHRIAARLERLVPSWRMYGKYLFRKK